MNIINTPKKIFSCRLSLRIMLLILLTASCKSTKKIVEIQPKVEEKEIIAVNIMAVAHEKNFFNAQTLEAKADVAYDDGDTSQNVDVKIRMEKDKIIWMSGTLMGIPLVKIMITPTKIRFYEKINKTYFDGDFSLLKQVFGVEMDFNQIQNLLLAQAFFPLKDGIIEKPEGQNFWLIPKKQNPKFDVFYLLNSANYKLVSQEAKLPNNETFKVSYPTYFNKGNQIIPKNILIESNQKAQKIKINLEFRNVELNQKLSFPFEIPDGYEKLDFSKVKP
jgi:hypothetical protein